MISSSPPSAQKPTVSLVIPGRNCAQTLEKCLNSVVPLLEQGELQEILFVDDGSTDNTAEIARRYPVRLISGAGTGAAAARNSGIEAASGDLIWCLDSDCIAEPDNLSLLVSEFGSSEVVAVGGSFGNATPDQLLPILIQQEISWRHSRMPQTVNFLASGNVVYRRQELLDIGGFDERFRWAHDAELAFRFRSVQKELHFQKNAIVLHHHFTSFKRYLSKQFEYARNRIFLYRRYPEMAKGDNYSSWGDHLQPPLALLTLLSSPLCLFENGFYIPLVLLLILMLLCSMTTVRLLIHSPQWRLIAFFPFTLARSFARAFGACVGMLSISTMKSQKEMPPQLSSREVGS